MELNKRIEKLIEYSGLSIPKFAERVGFKTPQGVRELLKGNTMSLSRQAQDNILRSFPEINPSWLLTGIGGMLKEPSPPTEPPPEDAGTILIPVASSDSIGGTRFNQEVNTEEYITGYLPFPTSIAHHGDVVIPIYGDSMEPTYKAGSMVLIREVELWREYLELGCTYVIGLVDDRRVIKTVMAGNDADHFLLVSINPAYQPQEIDKKIIRSVWRVIVSVRREAL